MWDVSSDLPRLMGDLPLLSRFLRSITLVLSCIPKVPRKGGPGVTQSDVLVINKTDLAPAVGASLEVMERDAKRMRNGGPTVFCQARQGLGLGVDDVVNHVISAWEKATKNKKK